VNLVWLRRAEADLDEAIDYIAPRNPAAALRFYETVREKTGLLPAQPGLGRPGRVHGTRELVVYPYIVAYTVQADIDAVVILRVLHGARQWPGEFEV
jgi:plasmid stabilization system protein ParE